MGTIAFDIEAESFSSADLSAGNENICLLMSKAAMYRCLLQEKTKPYA